MSIFYVNFFLYSWAASVGVGISLTIIESTGDNGNNSGNNSSNNSGSNSGNNGNNFSNKPPKKTNTGVINTGALTGITQIITGVTNTGTLTGTVEIKTGVIQTGNNISNSGSHSSAEVIVSENENKAIMKAEKLDEDVLICASSGSSPGFIISSNEDRKKIDLENLIKKTTAANNLMCSSGIDELESSRHKSANKIKLTGSFIQQKKIGLMKTGEYVKYKVVNNLDHVYETAICYTGIKDKVKAFTGKKEENKLKCKIEDEGTGYDNTSIKKAIGKIFNNCVLWSIVQYISQYFK